MCPWLQRTTHKELPVGQQRWSNWQHAQFCAHMSLDLDSQLSYSHRRGRGRWFHKSGSISYVKLNLDSVRMLRPVHLKLNLLASEKWWEQDIKFSGGVRHVQEIRPYFHKEIIIYCHSSWHIFMVMKIICSLRCVNEYKLRKLIK